MSHGAEVEAPGHEAVAGRFEPVGLAGEQRRGGGTGPVGREQLAGQPGDAKIAASLADPFMFQDHYRDRTSDFLGKEFGPQFAQAVAALSPASWQGPVESGFGWHLVFVDTVIPGRVPAFEEIESEARTAWLAEQKVLAWQKAYKEMRAKYTVLLPAPPDPTSAQTSAAPSGQGTRPPSKEAAR